MSEKIIGQLSLSRLSSLNKLIESREPGTAFGNLDLKLDEESLKILLDRGVIGNVESPEKVSNSSNCSKKDHALDLSTKRRTTAKPTNKKIRRLDRTVLKSPISNSNSNTAPLHGKNVRFESQESSQSEKESTEREEPQTNLKSSTLTKCDNAVDSNIQDMSSDTKVFKPLRKTARKSIKASVNIGALNIGIGSKTTPVLQNASVATVSDKFESLGSLQTSSNERLDCNILTPSCEFSVPILQTVASKKQRRSTSRNSESETTVVEGKISNANNILSDACEFSVPTLQTATSKKQKRSTSQNSESETSSVEGKNSNNSSKPKSHSSRTTRSRGLKTVISSETSKKVQSNEKGETLETLKKKVHERENMSETSEKIQSNERENISGTSRKVINNESESNAQDILSKLMEYGLDPEEIINRMDYKKFKSIWKQAGIGARLVLHQERSEQNSEISILILKPHNVD